jgi:hypothetical protein
MFKRLRTHMTYANVIATMALFVALGTGGAYAANTIGGVDVIDESLTDADIQDGSLAASIRAGAISSSKLADASVNSAKIASSAVQGGTSGDVLDNSITDADVNESTLQKVPSAALADKATTANSAPVKGYELLQKIVDYNDHPDPNGNDGRAEGTVSCPAGKRVLAGSYHNILWFEEDGTVDSASMHGVEEGSSMIIWGGAGYRARAYDWLGYRLVIRVTCGYVQ